MATADLKKIFGGGEFIPSFISNPVSIQPGAAGVLASIEPPPGKKAAILYLVASGSSGQVLDTEVKSGDEIILKGTIRGSTGDIGSGFRVGLLGQSESTIEKIVALNADEILTINKLSGVTEVIFRYIYAYGE